MKTIEFFLNVIHYSFYKISYKAHLAVNWINPFRLIHKLPFQKRRYEQLGIDIDAEVNKAWKNRRDGLSVTFAGGALLGTLLFLLISIAKGIMLAFYDLIDIPKLFYFISGGMALVLSYFFVFKRDKYVIYFLKFDHLSRKKKLIYCLLTLCIGLASFCLMFPSLYLDS